MEKAIEGGITICKKNWLDNYQNTLYQNKFDIDTAAAMKQVADISSSSMAKQVALSDSDKAVMIKDQSIMINRMRETMEKQAEELRLLREKHLKSELLDEYKKDLKDKGLNEEQIDRAVKEELDRRIPVV